MDNKPIIPSEWQAATPHRAYLALCLWHSAQIQPDGGASDTLGTLSQLWHREVWELAFEPDL